MSATNPNSGQDGAANTAFLIEMLGKISFLRAFEQEVWSLTQVNPPLVAGSMHLCAGQEVVPLAALAALRDDGQVLCTYRGHGWALAAGLDPEAVMAEICQRSTGLNGGRAGSAYMMAPDTRFIGENSIVGAGTTMACGVALANRSQGRDNVVVVTIGDGAMNQGSVHEAMVFASVRKLPVIFVVENNGWSEFSPTSRQFAAKLEHLAAAFGASYAKVDGNDVLAVADAAEQAGTQLRAGNGPFVLECMTTRVRGHFEGDSQKYREAGELQSVHEHDPLTAARTQLQAMGVDAAGIDQAIAAQVDAAVEAARADMLPTLERAIQDVYTQAVQETGA